MWDASSLLWLYCCQCLDHLLAAVKVPVGRSCAPMGRRGYSYIKGGCVQSAPAQQAAIAPAGCTGVRPPRGGDTVLRSSNKSSRVLLCCLLYYGPASHTGRRAKSWSSAKENICMHWDLGSILLLHSMATNIN